MVANNAFMIKEMQEKVRKQDKIEIAKILSVFLENLFHWQSQSTTSVESVTGRWFTEESMYQITDSILKYNGEYTIDYKKKYTHIKKAPSATEKFNTVLN